MQTNLVTISDKWQVVIPKLVRKQLDVKPKDKVIIYPLDSHRFVADVVGKSVVKKAFGALKKYDTDGKTFERMLKEKRKDLEYEDRKRK